MRNRIRNAEVAFVPEQASLGITEQDIAGTSAVSFSDEGAASLPSGGFPGISAERLALLMRTDPRDDSDVRSDVLRALMLDSQVPLSVGAQVQEGIVTLTGSVSWHHQRKDAIYLAGCIPGVLGVIDNLVLIPAPRDGDGH
jgi:hypothetical protein